MDAQVNYMYLGTCMVGRSGTKYSVGAGFMPEALTEGPFSASPRMLRLQFPLQGLHAIRLRSSAGHACLHPPRLILPSTAA